MLKMRRQLSPNIPNVRNIKATQKISFGDESMKRHIQCKDSLTFGAPYERIVVKARSNEYTQWPVYQCRLIFFQQARASFERGTSRPRVMRSAIGPHWLGEQKKAYVDQILFNSAMQHKGHKNLIFVALALHGRSETMHVQLSQLFLTRHPHPLNENCMNKPFQCALDSIKSRILRKIFSIQFDSRGNIKMLNQRQDIPVHFKKSVIVYDRKKLHFSKCREQISHGFIRSL